ncbi:MAG: biopolymer transporter ExbD [Phycisphaeraceae bacterium]|nr:biopolymer transporter ExbD [Phycisphaeraceae bacterium]
MSRVHRRGFARVEAVLTPLMDMGFLLIVFFALVSHITHADAVRMDLPQPSPSAAGRAGDQPRAVINALADDEGRLRLYRLGGRDFEATVEGRGALAEAITSILREQPTTEFALRADRRLPWRSVAPILESASRAASVATPGRPARVRLVVAEER